MNQFPPLTRRSITAAYNRRIDDEMLVRITRSGAALPRFTGEPVREEIGRARLATRLRFLGASSVCLWVALACVVYFGAQLVRGWVS